MIKRNCPLCKSNKFDCLISVNYKDFVDINPSLDRETIYRSDIINLNEINIVKCRKCKFVFTSEVLDEEGMSVIYGKIIDANESKTKIFKNSKRLFYSILKVEIFSYLFKDKIENSDKLEVLEFGSGWGDFALNISAPGVEVSTVEYDDRKRDYMNKTGIHSVKSFEELSTDKKYNIFFSNAVFEHIVNPREILSSIDKYLSDEFIGLIIVPNYSQERLERSLNGIREGRPFDKSINTWEHVNYFSPEKLWDLINDLHYEVVDINTSKVIPRKEISDTKVYFRRSIK